jgi:YVTN family beta-propeller protein
VNPLTNLIYVANLGSDTVSVIDGATNTVVATIPVATPFVLGVNPKTHLIYVSQPGIPLGTDNTVSVINSATNAVVSIITVGPGPFGVGVNPVTNMIYVATHFSDTVSVISGK